MDKKLARTGCVNSALLAAFFVISTLQNYARGSVFWTVLGVVVTGYAVRDSVKFYRSAQ